MSSHSGRVISSEVFWAQLYVGAVHQLCARRGVMRVDECVVVSRYDVNYHGESRCRNIVDGAAMQSNLHQGWGGVICRRCEI